MLNFKVTGVLEQTEWNGCPYSPQIAIKHAQFNVGKLYVNLNGKYSFIYDSILTLLTDSLADQFDQLVGDALVEELNYYSNNGLDGLWKYVNDTTDMRFLSLSLNKSFITAGYPGQNTIYYETPGESEDDDPVMHVFGWNSRDSGSPGPYQTNDDVQYHVSVTALQS